MMAEYHKKRAKAFTLTEVMTVIIIIGVLAAIALPSFRIQMMKVRNGEATRILMALWEAQRDLERETGAYTANINSLDVIIPASRNFGAPIARNLLALCGENVLATIDVNGNAYTLAVTEEGNIICGQGGDCTISICTKMGYPSLP